MFKGSLGKALFSLFVSMLLFCSYSLHPAFAATGTLKVSGIEAPNIIHRVGALADLKNLKGSPGRKAVYVEGRLTAGDGYEGTFFWLSGDQSANAKMLLDTQEGIFVKPTSPGDGSSGIWKRQFTGDIVIDWFGAAGDGVTNDYAALQGAIIMTGASRLHITGEKTYYSASTLVPNDKMTIYGDGMENTTISTDAGKILFWWNPENGISTLAGFHMRDIKLKSDYGIKINDTDTYIGDGQGDPNFMMGSFKRIYFLKITDFAGTAFEASRMFDTHIEDCHFAGPFNIAILLNGCDLNMIENNRITRFHYGIINVSAQTFGSQNEIRGNDILSPHADSRFIVTTDHHVSIYNNYLEYAVNETGSIALDVSNVDGLSYGSNVQNPPYSIDIHGNRIDGMAYLDYVHRVDASNAYSVVIKDRNHANWTLGTSVFTSTNNDVPMNYAGYNNRYMEIQGASWGDIWDGFITLGNVENVNGVYSVDGRNTASFLPIQATAALRGKGKLIVMPSSMLSSQTARITPDETDNLYFPAGETITVTLTARTTSATGDNLSMFFMSSEGNLSATGYTLDTQFKKYTYTFTAPTAAATQASIALSRSTQNGEIEIANVSWTY